MTSYCRSSVQYLSQKYSNLWYHEILTTFMWYILYLTAEVGHMVLESSHFSKILRSLADYSQEVRHNIVGMLGHLTANGL